MTGHVVNSGIAHSLREELSLDAGDLTIDRVKAIWAERASRPGHSSPTESLGGRRVLTLESRRSPELALRRHGLPIDFEPSHPKMGVLIKEVAQQCDALLRAKRCLESTT